MAMLAGPASRSNGGCSDWSAGGLLAYGAGSSVVVADPRSVQLLCCLPMPSPTSDRYSGILPPTAASFVTSVRWFPVPLPHHHLDLLAMDPDVGLRLAAGDRQGRIAVWDLRTCQVAVWLALDDPEHSRLAVQDICWIRSASPLPSSSKLPPSSSPTNNWLLASIHGPSLLALWDPTAGRCLWMYDASPEHLSCLRRDPFDARHLCALGIRTTLLSLVPLPLSLGSSSTAPLDVSVQQLSVPVNDPAELQRLTERELSSGASISTAPAHVAYPLFFARLSFSPLWRHILYITFPRELVVFDLQYRASLSTAPPPRGCGKFIDVMADPELDVLYCAHLDGKLSIWRRKEGEQVHVLLKVEELMPILGSPVPAPAVLAVTLCQSESYFYDIYRSCFYPLQAQSFRSNDSHHTSSMNQADLMCITTISDDGKVWCWQLTLENARDYEKLKSDLNQCAQAKERTVLEPDTNAIDNPISSGGPVAKPLPTKQLDSRNSNSVSGIDMSIKITLIGQLHLLSSTVTTVAVPSPSLLATVARGGNNPAPAVPLVALGTQNGTIEVVDVSANSVSVSFAVHSNTIRGLKWLGNSRIVSFSYSQVNDKGGGYINRLVITCVRSGLNRSFRVLQKPERAPVRALRASSSGRYLVILFRDAPVEVWAMTKNPIMIRSLALPFTVLEWTLPAAPRPGSNISQKQASSDTTSSENSTDDISESFAFALVNGALGVFEVYGRRIRDFRPKWPSSTFASSDGLVTAMAYRLPHVVMGDRAGNIRWWDVTTGISSSFNTHREGIRRIKFSPVVPGDRSRGRIAVLFYDNTFSIFDLDTPDPLANALLQPQSPGTLVLELDWLPMRTNKDEPLVLCIAGADSSFRLIDINTNTGKSSPLAGRRFSRERFRPMPLCLPALLPTAHALALRIILQLGVKVSWFNCSTDTLPGDYPEKTGCSFGDLRSYMIETQLPSLGDPVVPELLLKVLEPYRKEGCILDDERVKLYGCLVSKGSTARLAFAATVFGDYQEALFWLQLPQALRHFLDRSKIKSPDKFPQAVTMSDAESASMLNRIFSRERSTSGRMSKPMMNEAQSSLMAFEQKELWESANERITWHEKLDGEDAIQKRVHELVTTGNLEAAVSLLLSTPPEGSNFYPNSLRAVVLSSAVSKSLHELAVKVVAANMVRTDKSLSGTHLLCAVGRYQEACSQLQDAGCWSDAATLAATHLQGSDYARVLQRWADYILHCEHNIWKALILYVAAGALAEALGALRIQQPDTAAMFVVACHEIYTDIISGSMSGDETHESSLQEEQSINFPSKNVNAGELSAVSEYYGQYQRKLVHLCMDTLPVIE